jgi:hypothetical protein
VSVHEAIAVGYKFYRETKDEVIMSENGKRLPVEVQNGTPVLPNDMCLMIIDEIEQTKRVKLRPIRVEAAEDDFELQSIWPHLNKVLKWLLVNEVDKAIEVIKVVACRRVRTRKRKGTSRGAKTVDDRTSEGSRKSDCQKGTH